MVKREKRTAQISEKRKREIVKAALSVFARKGYAHATVDDIAREAEVAVGTLYKYYESKKHILLEVINAFVFNDNFMDQLTDNGVEDDSSYWSSMIQGPIQTWLNDPSVQVFLLCEILRDPELRRHYADEIYKPLFKITETYIKNKQDTGVFRQVDPSIMPRIIFGIGLGFMIIREIEGTDGPCFPMSVMDIAKEITEQGLLGLLAREDNNDTAK